MNDQYGESGKAYSPQNMPWGDVINYLTNPAADVPPNKASGAHARWSQTLPDNGAVRSAIQASAQFGQGYGAQDSFEGGAGASREPEETHEGDHDVEYGEEKNHGS